jgi:hypothetical protein
MWLLGRFRAALCFKTPPFLDAAMNQHSRQADCKVCDTHRIVLGEELDAIAAWRRVKNLQRLLLYSRVVNTFVEVLGGARKYNGRVLLLMRCPSLD